MALSPTKKDKPFKVLAMLSLTLWCIGKKGPPISAIRGVDGI